MNTPSENLEMLKQMTNEGYDAARQLGDINLRTWSKLAAKQIDMFGTWCEVGIKQMEAGTSAKDFKDYFGSQAAVTRELAEKMLAGGRDAISTGNEVQGEYQAWYENSVQTMTDRWNTINKQSS